MEKIDARSNKLNLEDKKKYLWAYHSILSDENYNESAILQSNEWWSRQLKIFNLLMS